MDKKAFNIILLVAGGLILYTVYKRNQELKSSSFSNSCGCEG